MENKRLCHIASSDRDSDAASIGAVKNIVKAEVSISMETAMLYIGDTIEKKIQKEEGKHPIIPQIQDMLNTLLERFNKLLIELRMILPANIVSDHLEKI